MPEKIWDRMPLSYSPSLYRGAICHAFEVSPRHFPDNKELADLAKKLMP